MIFAKLFFWRQVAVAGGQVSPNGAAQRSKMMAYDQPLVWVSLSLLLLGMVMVYSASIALPESSKYAGYKNTHFLLRQLIFIGAGLVLGLAVFRIQMKDWERFAPWLFVVALVLLVLVLVPGVGKGVNGARRWLPFKLFNFQPSELMKLAMVLYAANYTWRKQDVMHRLTKGFMPMAAAVGLVGLLLLLEPDLGAFGVIVCIAMGILFLGGINGVWFSGISATLVGIFGMVVLLSPWRRERIFAYLNPWVEENALAKLISYHIR